jgi:CheY-like chemotaxis protein
MDEPQSLTVLLVEDSEEDIFFFKRAFAKSGIELGLALARDGNSAISLLSDDNFRARLCLVFLDLKLPLMNGFEVLRWMHAQNLNPSPPVIVLSGSSHKSDKARATELGAREYVVKPISAETIRQHLEHTCPAAVK